MEWPLTVTIRIGESAATTEKTVSGVLFDPVMLIGRGLLQDTAEAAAAYVLNEICNLNSGGIKL